ncbi:MAG: hypothetical protein IJU95_10475 [Treponema sp.]|nr:hypothetical protein [Treponema sp.]
MEEKEGFTGDIDALISDLEDDPAVQEDFAAAAEFEDRDESPASSSGSQGKAGPSGVQKAPIGAGNVADVDLSVRSFARIEKFFDDKPNPVFDDPAYYKTSLGGEGESAQRLHAILVKYLNCTDKKDRTVYRQQIVSVYWNFLRTLAPKMVNTRLPLCKRLAMRYGVVLPSLFSPEQKEFFGKAILDNYTGEPILYMDEWIREVAIGKMKPSTTDEIPVKGGANTPGAQQAKAQAAIGKASGKVQSADSLVSMKEAQRDRLEEELQDKVKMLMEHNQYSLEGLEKHKYPYTDLQKKTCSEIANLLKDLQRLDKEIEKGIEEIKSALSDINRINDNMAANAPAESEKDSAAVDQETILGEMTTMRQMAKMTCGRQGNQFPVFTREFFHCLPQGTGFRENVIKELAWIESIDPGCFVRIHRNMPNRIVPYTLLVPTYGDSGFCWEPFDRYNRITSRGRICIPMYPRNLKIACLTAVADLRWQVAKEKASFDWMSDGLTGMYYQWIDGQKLKGDLKQFFIADYILWITKEALGQQKLPKEVRGIFWRYMPYPQELKDKLKKMSLTYQELCQRDANRAMSDGY